MDGKLLPLFAALLLSAAPPAPAPQDVVRASDLRAHIAVLASDAYQGRKPGTEGGAKTEAYLIDAFGKAGLKPGYRGGWTHAVELIERKAVSSSLTVRLPRSSYRAPAAELVAIGRGPAERIANAPLLFGGHAISVPGGRDDFSGVAVKGAIVLMLSEGAPKGTASVADRRRALEAQGAAAVIAIGGGRTPWPRIESTYRDGRNALAAAPMAIAEGVLAPAAGEALLRAAGLDPARLAADAGKPGFRALRIARGATLALTTTVRRYTANNIVGMIPGSDPAAGAVMFTAHWDHLGLCRPEGAPDRICNGAVDNASGTAALIEIARRLAEGQPPKRSLYFIATTAEEMGLLGARAIAAAPPVPLGQVAALLNLDTIAIAPAGAPVATIGRGRPALDALIAATARGLGRLIDSDDEADAFVQRQDGWEFGKLGVPAVMIGGGFSDMKTLNGFLEGDYHGPGDQLRDSLPLEGAAEDATLHVALGRALADPARYPAP